jgi:hypothetical protein
VNRNRVSFRQQLCGGVALRLAPAVTPPALHFFRSPTADRSWFKTNSLLLIITVSGKAGTPCCSPERYGKNVGNEAIQTNYLFSAREIAGGV